MAIRSFGEKVPRIGMGVYVDEAASVIGDVQLHDGVSVWPGAVIRGDDARVEIGKGSAVMDQAFIEGPSGRPVVVAEGCLISHGTRLHGCVVKEGCLVGIGAIVLDKACVGANSVIAAGALVAPGMDIPPGSIVMGSPGKVSKPAGQEDREYIKRELDRVAQKARIYAAGSTSR